MVGSGVSKIILLFVVLLSVGCSKKEEPVESPPNPEPVEVIAKEDGDPQPEEAPPQEPPVVTLVSAGKPPLRELRWQFTKGQKQEMNVNVAVAVELNVGEGARPATSTPPTFFDIELSVDEIDPDGKALIGLRVTGAGVAKSEGFPPHLVAGLQLAMAEVVGIEGSYKWDARGLVTDLTINTPTSPSPAIRQAVENIKQLIPRVHAPLPEEAIGNGGSWAVESTFTNMSVVVKQREVFTIKKLRSKGMAVDIETTQNAGAQTMTNSQGKTAQLDSLKGEANGSAQWNLKKLAPKSLGMTSKTIMNMNAQKGEEKKNVVLTVTQTVAINGS